MHTDTAILTGAHHVAAARPCQDYCAAGVMDTTRAWAIVADGCSTGGQTDLGARAWALAARAALRERPESEPTWQALQAAVLGRAHPRLQELEFADGYATLGVLTAHAGLVQATVFGDGALIARHLDGGITFVNLQYTDNAPFYLNYLRDAAVAAAWRAEYPGQVRRVVAHRFDDAGDLVALKTTDEPAETPFHWTADVDADELELVMLTTDGIGDCGGGLFAAVRELAAVKTATGEFMHRRVAKLARQWARTDRMPSDDLAVAAIWLRETALDVHGAGGSHG